MTSEAKLIDLCGEGESTFIVLSLIMTPDKSTVGRWRAAVKLRHIITSKAEAEALTRAIPNAASLYERGQYSNSNEKFRVERVADDVLKVSLWDIDGTGIVSKMVYRTSKVETVLDVHMEIAGLTVEERTRMLDSYGDGGNAPLEWSHDQIEMFAAKPTAYTAVGGVEEELPAEM